MQETGEQIGFSLPKPSCVTHPPKGALTTATGSWFGILLEPRENPELTGRKV
jgi:hypothetical protein